MQQKIIQVGNSKAITIPQEFMDILKSVPLVVDVEQVPQKRQLIVNFSESVKEEDIVDKEVYKVAKNLLKRYLPAFKELAKK